MKMIDLHKMGNAAKVCGIMGLSVALSACSLQELKDRFAPQGSSESVYGNLPASLVVCRSKQCAPTTANMSKEFLYNAYYSLMENNIGTNVLLCSADSVTHVCYEPFINFEITAGVTPATVAIDAARVVDVGIQKNNQNAVPVLNYSIYTNGVRARCNPSSAYVSVKDPSYMVIDNDQAICQFTATGSSSMSIVMTVDYIDLDYGIIGGYYSAGVSGTSYGGGKGYALMRFEKPVNPDIYCQQKNASCSPFKPMLPEYNCCKGFDSKTVHDKSKPPCNKFCDGVNPTTEAEQLAPSSKVSENSDASVKVPNGYRHDQLIPTVPDEPVTNAIPPAPIDKQRPEPPCCDKAKGHQYMQYEYPPEAFEPAPPHYGNRMPHAVQWMDDVEHMHRDAAYSRAGRNIRYEDPDSAKDLVVISPVPKK